ncbi:unnamed protein product [Gadus morhua 'NCC']
MMGSSWIGLSDREKEGTLKWVDGTPMTSSWRHVKPRDDGGARDCVVAGEDGWSEEPCNRLQHWICEKVLDLDHLETERNKEGSVMPTEDEEEAPSITEFHSSTHVLPVGNGPLHLPRRRHAGAHSGRYGVNMVCCMASNSAGTANPSAELLVFDACELTLDPNTAYRRLSLSEDNRKVTAVGEVQSVGVYLDRPAGSLSFYRVSPGGGGSSDTLTHLHTFCSSFTQEDLLPGVWVWWGASASLCRL